MNVDIVIVNGFTFVCLVAWFQEHHNFHICPSQILESNLISMAYSSAQAIEYAELWTSEPSKRLIIMLNNNENYLTMRKI